MKIAFVHDYLVQYGGAERVLEALTEIWPQAPIYTLISDPKKVHDRFSGKIIRNSFLQKIPFSRKYHRIFPVLMMPAIEQFDLDYYDVVVSDSSSFAKNVITGPNTLHICYCHTPMRYAWDDCQYYTQEFGFPGWLKKVIPFLMNYIRAWDYYSTNGVDHFVANSLFVKGRIKKYYQRTADVVNPPVDIDNFKISLNRKKKEKYFLMVGRMMKYKKMDLAIRAFNELKLPLKIVGRGSEYGNLKKISNSNVDFLGRVTDEELASIYSEAEAFIFPQEEDFGIVAIEAFACGRPVIAYNAGDIKENIIEGKTGILFNSQTKESLMEAVEKFKKINFNSHFIRCQAKKFDKKIFKKKIKELVEKKFSEWREGAERTNGNIN